MTRVNSLNSITKYLYEAAVKADKSVNRKYFFKFLESEIC